MEQVTKMNFKGQSIYVGIDVHNKSWTATFLVDEIDLYTKTFPPSGKLLGNYLRKNFPGGNYLSVYEAGYCGYWVHEDLLRDGVNNIIVNPADVPTTDKEKKKKRDPVDSRKLAKSLRNGDLKSIFIPDKQQQEDKLLLRTRVCMVKKQTSCKNQIKSTLSFFGIFLTDEKIRSHWSKAYISWLRKISKPETSQGMRLIVFLDELEHLRIIIAKLTKQIRQLSTLPIYNKRVSLLRTIPGISILTAMTILTEFGDLNVYSSLDKLCSYVGLTGDEHSSGDKEKKLGMTKRGNRFLRKVLIESSWVAIRKDPALLLEYKKYTRSYAGAKSIIKISRKLLNRIRYVLMNEKEYKLQTI